MPIHNTVSSPPGPSAAIEQGGRRIDPQKLKKACADFEALFLARMLKMMRQSIPQTGFLGPGPGKDIFQTMMEQELSRKMAERGGMGLGTRLYKQMIRQEEKARPLPQELSPLRLQGRSNQKIGGDYEGAGRPSASPVSDD